MRGVQLCGSLSTIWAQKTETYSHFADEQSEVQKCEATQIDSIWAVANTREADKDKCVEPLQAPQVAPPPPHTQRAMFPIRENALWKNLIKGTFCYKN